MSQRRKLCAEAKTMRSTAPSSTSPSKKKTSLAPSKVPFSRFHPSFRFFSIIYVLILELATASGVSEAEIRKFYKIITRVLPSNVKKPQPVNPADLCVLIGPLFFIFIYLI